MAEGGNSLAPRLSEKWVHRVQRVNPYWIRLQTDRDYGEILAEKVEKSSSISRKLFSLLKFTRNELQYGKRLLKERYLDKHIFMEVLDLYRRSKDPTLGYELLMKIMKMDPMPKEADYLAEQLMKNTSRYSKKELEKIKNCIKKIKKLRDSGNEGAFQEKY